MNLLLYLTLLKMIFLYIYPTINCDDDYKIFVCNQNKINVLYDTTNKAKSKLSCLPTSTSCFPINKLSKNNDIINEPKYKGPIISELIQSGIQETIRFTKKNTDKDTYRFYESNNLFVDIPFPTKGFKFRAFAPDNFLSLRNVYKISEDFDTEFQTSYVFSGPSYKNFVDTYYITRNYKYYINIITEKNFEFIVSYLSKYFSHFCENKNSLLPKIAGLFHLKHKNFELYFIVKPYIFPNVPISLDELYYTKGIPEKGPLINYDKSSSESCHTEYDTMIHFREGLLIPSDTYKSLQNVLKRDTEFLKSIDVSDYIFMLSVSSSDKSSNTSQPELFNKLMDVRNPDQFHKKTANLNLIAYIGIDNIYQQIKKTDQSYYTFRHYICMFKHQVNQDIDGYGEHFMNFITRKLFKSNGNNL